ncbi:MAG: hypothetical protein EOP10_35360 [Proteobacteria bacterium]|nr:MAG: hypothetical protein EOP10_35360 [Pseudomonadota bacterium]
MLKKKIMPSSDQVIDAEQEFADTTEIRLAVTRLDVLRLNQPNNPLPEVDMNGVDAPVSS